MRFRAPVGPGTSLPDTSKPIIMRVSVIEKTENRIKFTDKYIGSTRVWYRLSSIMLETTVSRFWTFE